MTDRACGVRVHGDPSAPSIDLSVGLLQPMVMSRGPRVRISLVATEALLLSGDEVRVDIEIGPGIVVDIEEATATVAHGGMAASRWDTLIEVGAGATVRYLGQPLVISDGADVARHVDYVVASGASLTVRESVIWGRHSQIGGRLRATTLARVSGTVVWCEQVDLDRHTDALPGLLGEHTSMQTWLHLGGAYPTGLVSEATSAPQWVTMRLLDDGGALSRRLGPSSQ